MNEQVISAQDERKLSTAVKRLVKIALNRNLKASVRFEAMKYLFNFGMGKPIGTDEHIESVETKLSNKELSNLLNCSKDSINLASPKRLEMLVEVKNLTKLNTAKTDRKAMRL